MSQPRPPRRRNSTVMFGPSTVTLLVFATVLPLMFFFGAGVIYAGLGSASSKYAYQVGNALAVTGVASFLLSTGILVIRYLIRS